MREKRMDERLTHRNINSSWRNKCNVRHDGREAGNDAITTRDNQPIPILARDHYSAESGARPSSSLQFSSRLRSSFSNYFSPLILSRRIDLSLRLWYDFSLILISSEIRANIFSISQLRDETNANLSSDCIFWRGLNWKSLIIKHEWQLWSKQKELLRSLCDGLKRNDGES